ncbi:MAG: hypothetical protein IPM66_14780 [Acidobacteriota bacterium]|nr:MAG: hypothetical protein IPM66_14780 [Acidobacteriota bacterium]
MWFKKKRQQISMSDLFSETLSSTFMEVNTRFIHSYWPSVGDIIGEQIAQNSEAFVSLLVKHLLTDLLESKRLKVTGVNIDSIDAEAAWRSGLKNALQNRSRKVEHYEQTYHKCIEAVKEYSFAYEKHHNDPYGPPTDIYFSACRHFTDLVTDSSLHDDMTVFKVAKDIFETTRVYCAATPKMFELNGT